MRHVSGFQQKHGRYPLNIHAQAPDFRLPCFLKRRLPYGPLGDFQGNPITLRCHHAMNEQDLCLPIGTDPLQRFHRACALFQNFSFRRGEPLVFDHQLHLKIRVRHDLNRKGFSPIWEVAKRNLFQHVSIQRVRKSLPFNPNFLSPPNSDTRINNGKREQGFTNTLRFFRNFRLKAFRLLQGVLNYKEFPGQCCPG